MGQYRGQYYHETDGKSLEYTSEYGPPSRVYYERKAASEHEGAKYRAGLERAGREYEAKKGRSR